MKKSSLAIQRNRAVTKSQPSAPNNRRRKSTPGALAYYARHHYGVLAEAGRYIVSGNTGKQGCHVGAF